LAYPAEICAAQLGKKVPGDESIEMATSVPGTGRERLREQRG